MSRYCKHCPNVAACYLEEQCLHPLTPEEEGKEAAERSGEKLEEIFKPITPPTPEEVKTPYCDICHIEPCSCNGLQSYGYSQYPGEHKLVPFHPKNQGADFYLRKDVEARFAALQTTLAERDATIAEMHKERDRETEFCMGLAMLGPDAVKEKFQEAAALKKDRDAALAVVGQMKPLLEQHHIYRKRHDTESKEGYTDFPICRESKEALTAATKLLAEHGYTGGNFR